MPVAVRIAVSVPSSTNSSRFRRPSIREARCVWGQRTHSGLDERPMTGVTIVEDCLQQPAKISLKPQQRGIPCPAHRPLGGEVVAKARPTIAREAGVSESFIYHLHNARDVGEPRQVVIGEGRMHRKESSRISIREGVVSHTEVDQESWRPLRQTLSKQSAKGIVGSYSSGFIVVLMQRFLQQKMNIKD